MTTGDALMDVIAYYIYIISVIYLHKYYVSHFIFHIRNILYIF